MKWMTLAASVALLAFASSAGASGPETFGIPNAAFPEPRVMTAGQPTGEQLQLLAEEGYKTVIDLRTAAEPRGFNEAEAAKQNGLAYVSLPVDPQTLDQATIDKFLETMRKAERPLILHCASSVRVGALYYAWLVLEEDVPPRAAMAKAKTAGLRSPELAGKIEKLVSERKAPAKK